MGSHRTRVTRAPRAPGVHARPVGPRHAARHPEGPSHRSLARSAASATSHARLSPAQARRRAAARERMLQRRRRSLGALSLLVLAVTVVITLTRPSPQEAVAASRDVTTTVPPTVYTSNAAAMLPPGAAADQAAAGDLSAPIPAATPVVAAKPVTWTQPRGATIHCPVKVTACVDLKAKITWLQHGSTIFLGPVRMQPGEGNKKTPRGTFTINKKAAVYYSHTYGGAMPYSVFWGHDGIAYHEGTLTGFSHGCIHLSMANAKKFFAALHKGERVYVA